MKIEPGRRETHDAGRKLKSFKLLCFGVQILNATGIIGRELRRADGNSHGDPFRE